MPENNINITFDWDFPQRDILIRRILRDISQGGNGHWTNEEVLSCLKFKKPKQDYTYGYLLNKLKETENAKH